MWESVVEPDGTQLDNVLRHIRCGLSVTKAADTPSEYVILTAFPLQPWLR
jgi:hypothetical protein